MKIIYTFALVFSFILTVEAQENKQTTKTYPQFESCEVDDQKGKACFENTFITKFKEHYKEKEIAEDYNYEREVIGYFSVDRRGKIIQKEFNTGESAMFVAIKRAIEELPKLNPILNEKDRPVDFYFEITFKLQRTSPHSENALSVGLEFTYPEATEKDS